MFSLFAQRAVTRFPSVFSAAKISRINALPLLTQTPTYTRRTFLATPLLAEPAKAATATKKKASAKTTKKPAAKKASAKKPLKKKKAAAKPKRRVVAKKKKVAAKKKPAKPKRMVLTPEMMPPKQPAGPYVLFYAKYMQSQPKATSLADTNAYAKTAGSMWRGLSAQEKKSYEDEHAANYVQYVKRRTEYFDKVQSSVLKEINRRRKKRGVTIIRRPTLKEERRPMPPYLRYLAEFRASPAGESIKANAPHGKIAATTLVVEGSKHWKMMSEVEKQPYTEPYQRDMAEWRPKYSAKAKASNKQP